MKQRILILFLAIILVLQGCTFNGKSNKKAKNKTEVIALDGGTLNLSSYTPDTLNPLTTQYSCVRDFLYLVYEGLFIVNEDLSVKGVLASGYNLTNGNSVCTVNLKKGIKFHDGSEFNANDVIATFEYIQNNSSVYSDNLSNVKAYNKVNDYSVEITLISPEANFVNNLDFPIMPSGLTQTDFGVPNSSFKPNGTGRYKYDKTNEYVSIDLSKNQNWHSQTHIYIPNVCIRFVKDNDSILYAFDSGETDLITTERGRWGEFSYNSKFRTSEITTTRYTFLGVNVNSSYLSDALARRVISQAIDKKTLVDSLLFSHGKAADTPVLSKAYFANPDAEQTAEEKTFDFKNATFYLLFNQESVQKQKIAEYIKRVLEEKGINIEFSKVDYETYVQRVKSGNYQLYIGEIDMSKNANVRFMFNYAPQKPADDSADTSPETGDVANDALPQEAAGTSAITGSAVSNYIDSQLDSLINNMNIAVTNNDARIAYENFRAYFTDNLPQIPLFHINDALFISSRIQGKPNKNLTNFYADLGNIYINYKKK